MKLSQLSLTVAALFIAASASAADPKLGIVYDAGGKFDKSFNQSAFEGASRFKKETNINFIEVQASSDTQAEQVLRGLARKNLDLIASIGFAQQQAVQKVAKEFPKVHFVLIDGVAQGANINSITFKEEEGSYLVGVAAAMASKSKKLGFIGGVDIPLIRTFSCGYAQGAKAVNPKVDVTSNMVGTTSDSWNNPAKGGELARSQFDRGVDVVFAVAGGSGLGTLQTAKEKGKLAIGVDSNDADLDGQARRQRRLRLVHASQERHLEGRRHRQGPEGRRRRLGAGREQPQADHAGNREARIGCAQGHHRRQGQGDRHPFGRRLPGLIPV
jgi:basic membrane protein A